MQFLKNKIFELLILLCGVLPLQGMLTKQTYQKFNKLKPTQPLIITKPQQINIPINEPVKIPDQTPNEKSNLLIKKPLVSSNIYSPIKTTSPFLGVQKRSYHPIPVQNSSSWNLLTALKNSFSSWYNNLSATLQSNKIIHQLERGLYAFDTDKNLQNFLENNSNDHIQYVVDKLLKYFDGRRFLQSMCERDPLFAIKILPLIQNDKRFMDNVIFPLVASTEFNNLIKTKKGIALLTTTLDSAISTKFNELIENTFLTTRLDSDLNINSLTELVSGIKEELSVANQYSSDFLLLTYNTLLLIDYKAAILDSQKKDPLDLISVASLASDLKNAISAESKKLIKTEEGIKLLTITLGDAISTKFNELIKTEKGIAFLESILHSDLNINSLTELVSVIKEELLADNKYTSDFLLLISNTLLFINYHDHLDLISMASLASDLKNAISTKFNELIKTKEGIALLKTTLGDDKELLQRVFNIDKQNETASYHHLAKFPSKIIQAFPITFDNPHFTSMIQAILQKEKELNDLGYETFYHGRRWQYGFLTDIYGILYEYKSGKGLHDFIFTQLDDPVMGNVGEKFYASETKKRERLIKEGNPFSYDTKTNAFGIANRQSLLFLNKFLFGNVDKWGSCSMYYVLNNHNMGEIAFSTEEIFNMFGLHDAYQAFADKLKQLQQEHDTLSQYGEMLQIAVPKDNIDKSVYYTTSGGPKKEFISTGDGKKITTTDIKTILADLDKNPQDKAEFVLVETRDKFGGLNPESGIKVFSYNLVDPDKWKAFKEKENALFNRIIQSIEQEDTIKQEKEQEKKVHQQARE